VSHAPLNQEEKRKEQKKNKKEKRKKGAHGTHHHLDQLFPENTMVGLQRDKKWRQSWQNAAPRADFSRPTDAVFAKAEAALLDPDRDTQDKKFAALDGVPQQVSNDLCFPMWIPARDLTVSFSDTEIMTSLGSTPQSPLWSKSLEHLRDFKTVRNAGISFVCTDRDVCTKLGGESVSICGRKFKVQPYSKYSHWYYVDLQRLPDDVADGVIYDWFAQHGTPPVYITPAHTVGGLRSRSRRVYFNQKSPPASVMVDKNTPLRQIQFTGQGYAVVHHRLQVFNRTIPPFIKDLRAKHRSTPAPKPKTPSAMSDTAESIPPVFDIESDASSAPARSEHSDSESEPHRGDLSDSESSHRSDMDGIEMAIVARPSSVWHNGKAPLFPVGPTSNEDKAPARIKRAKLLIFGEIATPTAEMQMLPPSQQEYPVLSSLNTYEWLSEGQGGTIPPDQDIVLWDRSREPTQSVGSFIGLSEVTESVLNSSVYQGNVEQLSLKELCEVIENFLANFATETDPDSTLATLQAQPSLHRVLLDTKEPGNFQHLRGKAFGHAVLRVVSTREFSCGDEGTVSSRLSTLYPTQSVSDYQTVLGQICPDQSQFWLQLRLAELDLALQIIAPSIYMDPLKIGSILGKAASALPHPLWHLWDDNTLASIIQSPLMAQILAGPLHPDLRDTVEYLQKQVTAVTTPVPTCL
jgi:hypothetical protein